MRHLSLVAALSFALLLALGGAAAAGDPRQDVAAANALVSQAKTKAAAGDLAGAERDYRAFETAWTRIEDGVRAASLDAYRAIEQRMSEVNAAFRARPADRSAVTAALAALEDVNAAFARGETVGATGTPSGEKASVALLLEQLDTARRAAERGDFATAASELDEFTETWPAIEGDIKARSAAAYRDTESDLVVAREQIKRGSADAAATLQRMSTRLETFQDGPRYGIFDASIILLREGLEALLVIVALSTFLVKSGNGGRRGWVWGGAAAGIGVSVALGVGIQLVLASVIGGTQRELIEGLTGLFAALMLLYVSYWLHSRSNLDSWQRYLRARTASALTRGGLLGIGALSFLAVFREGAETVLFYLGMASNIALSDLLIGLGIGAAGLVILGALMTLAGLRIPMRPFFTVASALVFYLCFKFIGTGIHALQVGGVVGFGADTNLPQIDVFGIFPTWASTIPQLVLLLGAAALLLRERAAGAARANRAA